jgi:hypothetical protein
MTASSEAPCGLRAAPQRGTPAGRPAASRLERQNLPCLSPYGDPADMVWEKRWVGHPTDTHFSAGGSSPLARADGTNKLETHATLGPRVEEDDQAEETPDLLKWAMTIGAGVLLGIGAIKAAPHVKSWWKDLRSKWNRRSENE